MSVAIEDEGLHPFPVGQDHWQESVVLYWRDAASGLAGTHRLGRQATADGGPRTVRWCGVFLPDGRVFRSNAPDLPAEPSQGTGLRTGDHEMFHDGRTLRYEADEPGLRMSLTLTDVEGTHVGFSKTADGAHESYNDQGGSDEGTFFSHHYESQVRVRGRVEVDGEQVDIDGLGWRDHSWGVRHWDEIWGCRFFAGGDGTPDNSYFFLAVIPPSGKLRRMGGLTLAGQRLEVEDVRMIAHVEDDWLRVPKADIVYTVAGGGTRTLHYKAVGGQVAVSRVVSWESVGDITMDGQPLGWALLEAVNNPRGSTNPPVFALCGGMTNGMSGP